jgi:G3E family GTPase
MITRSPDGSRTTVSTPFTILTGWLGAGKTTALNRMLGAPHGRRIAVLVNELGRIAIDSRLIIGRGGDVLELAGGCICCRVDLKSDLWDGIGEVVRRSRPDQVVLETTGIAEPPAILEGLDRVAADIQVAPAGVVCVVDGEAGAAALDRRDEAREQVLSADRILLSKLDVASADAVAAAHARIVALNGEAERASFPTTDDGAMAMTAWLLEPRSPRRRPPRHAHRHGQLVAAAYSDDAPLVAGPLMAYLTSLGDRLVRAKGFVHLAGEERRGFVERAGAQLSLRTMEAWGDEPRKTEIVLIGELEEAEVRRALWACRAGG